MYRYTFLFFLLIGCISPQSSLQNNETFKFNSFCETAKEKGKKCIKIPKYCPGQRFNYPCHLNIDNLYSIFDGKPCEQFEAERKEEKNQPNCWLMNIYPNRSIFLKEKNEAYCESLDGIKCDTLIVSVEYDTLNMSFIGGGFTYHYDTSNDSISYSGFFIK